MHFEDGDPVAVCTLADAASSIFSTLAESGVPPDQWIDRVAWEANKIDRRQYFSVMRTALLVATEFESHR